MTTGQIFYFPTTFTHNAFFLILYNPFCIRFLERRQNSTHMLHVIKFIVYTVLGTQSANELPILSIKEILA